MFAGLLRTLTLAFALVLASQTSGAADAARSAFLGPTAGLNGFLRQIHRFYTGCGERLGDVRGYLSKEQKWKEMHADAIRIDEAATKRVQSWMSGGQRDTVEVTNESFDQAFRQTLRGSDDAQVRKACTSFIANMEDEAWIEKWLKPLMEKIRKAESNLDAIKQGLQ
jgi:hypothetical protein